MELNQTRRNAEEQRTYHQHDAAGVLREVPVFPASDRKQKCYFFNAPESDIDNTGQWVKAFYQESRKHEECVRAATNPLQRAASDMARGISNFEVS